MHASFLLHNGAIAGQAGLVLAGIAALALWPPRDGSMVLIALDGRDAATLVAPAIDAGAMLAGRGPMANMILVSGSRAKLVPLIADGVVVLAAPRGLCGPGGQA